ncbi:Winged helix DNA-binding domain-containing protein [Bifidobacterium bohemicum]|uniref:Transcriptional regulator n=1 Tax=Bifidobacterium bohemicum DSM 22767 TaxID=1437606 RepID=A0A086ZFK6_9BIFI|nr:transcriptional regulator [Bifidobacterium bohemicum]KFI45306.1 transcriptional regulator [Bifidobacterium bohemicum DSM 22767]SCC20173.1 Winged helix DNA-binding domain-containing protein [Bifidobacterium bohemicum]
MSDQQLDPIIHAPSRLRIMTILTGMDENDSPSFPKSKQQLGVANGNLSVHLTKLEQAEYVAIEKTFEGHKLATYVSVTAKGERKKSVLPIS